MHSLPEPHEYQKEGIKFLLQKSYAGLFWPPGLGKTRTVLTAIKLLRTKKIVNRVLIISTVRIIHQVWPREVEKWQMPFSVAIAHGSEKDRMEALESNAIITLINFEMIPWLFSKGMKKYLKGFDMLVIDESSKMKNVNTKRFKAIRRYLDYFARRVIMTGSPAPNGLMNLFSQMYIVDMGESLGEFVVQFRNRYFFPCGYKGYEWQIMEGADKKIYEAISKRILRYSERVLDMPELVIVPPYKVTLPDEVRKLYDEMEEVFLTEHQGRILTAENAATATGKLRQIANGGIYYREVQDVAAIVTGTGKRSTLHLHDEKVTMLKEIIEELQGSPCLVAYEFNHDLEKLLAAFPGVPYLGSGVTPKESARIEDEWNAGRLPIVFIQPASFAHGLNLQDSGCDVIYFSLTWDLENYEQLYRRVWRQGQKSPEVRIHHILAEDTIDEVIIKVLHGKELTQKSLLDALEDYTMLKDDNVVVPTDDEIRLLAAEMLTRKVERLPRYDAHDTDKSRRDRNFVSTIQQAMFSSWDDATYIRFLKIIKGKAPAKKVQEDMQQLKAEAMKCIFKMFKITGTEKEPVLTDEPFVVEQVGFVNRKSAPTEDNDMATKTKKSPTKKSPTKKSTAKKVKVVAKAKTKTKAKTNGVAKKRSARTSENTVISVKKMFESGVRADCMKLINKTHDTIGKVADVNLERNKVPVNKTKGYLAWLIKHGFVTAE